MAIIEDENTFQVMDRKSTPTGADKLQIADAADGGRVKSILISDLPVEAGVDSNAIHVDEAGEIAGITAKAAPTILDLTVIEDAAAANVKKSIVLGAIMKAVGWIAGLTAKATPVAADLIAIEDSAAAGAIKKSTVQQLFAALGLIDGLTAKATPIAADTIAINDSAAAGAAKKATIGSIPVAQAQVAGLLLEPAADAAAAILSTTRSIRLTVTAAGNVAISTSSNYAGQVINLFAVSVGGGGSYTLALDTGTLTLNATGESAVIQRSNDNASWKCVGLSGATIV